jgi:hypothetical protein
MASKSRLFPRRLLIAAYRNEQQVKNVNEYADEVEEAEQQEEEEEEEEEENLRWMRIPILLPPLQGIGLTS